MFYKNGWVSLILFFSFLYLTDFLGGFVYIMHDTSKMMEMLLRPSIDFSDLDLQKQLVIFHTYQKEAEDKHIDTTVDDSKIDKTEKKKVYIYNSHQNETYKGGKTVVDAALYLAEKLESQGYQVVVELNDFNKYAKKNGYSYDALYDVSRIFLKQALVDYDGFDYVIDLHRDGVGNANTSVVYEGESYAKMMFVISSAHDNYHSQTMLVKKWMKMGNAEVNGIFKNISRKYYTIFNQDVLEHVYLLEMGSNNNTFDEVQKSIDIFSGVFTKGVQS